MTESPVKKTKILVVEDEAVISMHIRNSLERLGYEVCGCADSGIDAIRIAEECRPDLILMDIVLHGDMDGVEAAKIIRDKLGTPVVYMTGNADIPTIMRARGSDPYGYILKPIDVLHMFSTIDTIMRRRDLELRLEESEERFREISENIQEGLALTIDFKNVWVNDAFAVIFGYTKEELIGKGPDMVMHQDDIPDIMRIGMEMIKGMPTGFVRARAIRKDGVEIIVDVNGRLFKVNESSAILLIVRDVTESVRYEAALRESEEKYRNLVEEIDDVIATIDENGIITFISAGVKNRSGYKPEELLGKQFMDFVYPADVPYVLKHFSEIRQGASKNTEYRIMAKSGYPLWISISSKQILKDGVFRGVRGVLSVIDEKKRAEEALRESEERYRTLTTNLPGVVYQFYTRDTGEQGMYYVDDRCRDLYGIESHPLESFFGRFSANIHPDDKEKFLTSVYEVIRKSSPWDWEGRYLHPRGNLMWIRGISQPMRSGNELIFNGLMLDITDRKIAEMKMRMSDERYRSMTNNLPGVVYQFYARDNGEMGLYYVDDHARDLWDIEVAPLDNFLERFRENIHPEDRESFLSSIIEAVHTASNWDWEGRYILPKGNEIWIKGISQPVRVGDELIFNGLMLDITDRKLAELKLQDSEEKFRGLVNNLLDAIIIMDSRGFVVFENPATKEMLGYSILGKLGFEIVHPDDMKKVTGAFSDVINKTNKHIPTLFRVRRADGSWLYIEVLASNLFDNKIIPGMLLVCRDITQRVETQTALRQSEERYRALFDQSPVGVFLFDKNLVVRECNDHFAEMMRTPREEIIGFDSKTQRETEAISQMHETIGGNPSYWEGWFHSPSRDMIFYHSVHYSPLRDVEGNVIGGIAVVSDLTDRKRAEKALQASEEQYRALFDQSPLGILQFDKNLIVTDCNDQIADLLGSTREKIIGIDLHLLREAEVIDKMKETIDGKVVTYQGIYHAITSDKVLFISVNTSPLRDENGIVIAGMGVIENITDRRMAEEQLKLSEERNRLLVENANESIIVLQDWKFVFTNPRFISLMGYSAEELVKQRFTEFVHPEDREKITERYLKRLDGDTTPLTYEIRFFNKEGAITWTEINSVMIVWEKKPAALLFIRDITERKLAEVERQKIDAQIQQTQKLESLGVLAGGIAHDFNNLLMAILGNIDLALLDTSPSSPTRSNLLEAAKASQRAADLCRQMLAYSGRGRFTSEALDINEIIEDMKHMLEVSVSKKAVLRYNFAAGIPAVEVDVTQVRQIIMNLVINASDAIGQKSGVISISTGVMMCDRAYLSETWLNENLPEGMYVYVEVVDTGCGIDPGNLPNIFDPFYTTKFTGRGLGLAAVLGIVRGHRGAIKVYSERGRGTTFKVLFPAADKNAGRISWKREVGDDWRGSGTILLVDDEETIRILGKRMLERFGFTVLTAENGREAIDIFRENPDGIRCVILDLTMPHMDGEEAFRELRRIQKDLRVIMSSGYNEQEINQRFAGKGIAGFIQKPYQMAELAAKLKDVLG